MSASQRKLRALHLASFAGNIGDLANHAGARRMLAERLDFALEFTDLEIREFYWKQRSFDDAFVEYANGFDLLIIGGGNYFELWVDHSATGTSIDITPERLARLKVPTLFFALGVDTGQGYSAQSAERFNAFIATVLERGDMFACVRNDGSTRALREVLGEQGAAHIPTMPDGGFFADPAGARFADADSGRIGINIAGDMLERRFDRGLDSEGFLRELADACRALMDARPELRIDLMPHIWRDSALIAQMLPMMPDPYLRRRVAVGRLEPGETGLAGFLQSYRGFDLVLGMRFHANVCPIGMGVPSRGLLNYPQVERLYEELNMADRVIDVRDAGFSKILVDAVLSDLENLSAQRQRCIECVAALHQQAHATLAQVDKWLHLNLD
ncbi:MAG: polysaccharide pyruvyl transferase family protein [Rhodocyclaceae bacterium]|nr:polysaccharide pyruvyl transferase family protein [Rhodocyclaceae bacterium]